MADDFEYISRTRLVYRNGLRVTLRGRAHAGDAADAGA